jgi:hypothetical protein
MKLFIAVVIGLLQRFYITTKTTGNEKNNSST